jgi:hypothetical protein
LFCGFFLGEENVKKNGHIVSIAGWSAETAGNRVKNARLASIFGWLARQSACASCPERINPKRTGQWPVAATGINLPDNPGNRHAAPIRQLLKRRPEFRFQSHAGAMAFQRHGPLDQQVCAGARVGNT